MKSILENYTGIIKDKLLAWQIQDYIGKNYPLFDSCYQVFLNECKNLSLKNSTINKVNSFELKNKISNSNTFEDASNVLIASALMVRRSQIQIDDRIYS